MIKVSSRRSGAVQMAELPMSLPAVRNKSVVSSCSSGTGLSGCQRGFALVETMIAALILSVGLIGYMQLLQADLKNTDSALYRNQAAIKIGDMFDRLRADSDDAVDGDYNITLNQSVTGSGDVAAQLTAWRSDLAAALPSGNGSVACTESTRICTITVSWDDRRGVGGVDGQTLAMSSLVQ